MLGVVMPFVGEYVDPECLARAAKCSRDARSLIAPMLERRLGDKETVRLLITRLFPGINGLPAEENAPFYRALLDAYFAIDPDAPMRVEVSYAVGHTLAARWLLPDAMEMTRCVMRSMRTADGRHMIAAAVRDWQAAVERRPMNYSNGMQLRMLEMLATGVRSDFAVLSGRITSRFDVSDSA
jgi:hypothetical protein